MSSIASPKPPASRRTKRKRPSGSCSTPRRAIDSRWRLRRTRGAWCPRSRLASRASASGRSRKSWRAPMAKSNGLEFPDPFVGFCLGPRKMPSTTEPPKSPERASPTETRGETGGVSLSDAVRSRDTSGGDRYDEGMKKGGKVKGRGKGDKVKAKLEPGEF